MIKWILSHWKTALIGLAVLVAAVAIGWWLKPEPKPIIITPEPGTTVVQLPGKEQIVYKDVIKYIKVEDREAVQSVMAENAKLKTQIQQLTVSLAASTSTGSGTVLVIPNAQFPQKPTYTFKDWRLSFTSDGETAKYTLSQKFVVVSGVGKTPNNVPINRIRLFEVGADGQRVPLQTVETTTIAIGPQGRHWYMTPTLQVGAAYVPIPVSANPTLMTTSKFGWSGVVALSWLKSGTSTSTEDTRYAYLTPAVVINAKETTVGMFPLSVNIGNFRHVPLTNVWLSPYVGWNVNMGKARAGMAITATF